MGLKGLPNVLDIRTVGLTAGIDLASLPDGVGKRGYAAMEHAFYKEEVMIRVAGDTIELTPPLVVTENEIDEIFDKVGKVIRAVA
jgi:beta-alanine--pyruvate transaminase